MSSSVLWHLRASATGRPLVMFPFLGGFGASYNVLVRELSGDWDVWTVNPPGHGPSTLPPASRLTDLVGCYVESLRDTLAPDAVFFGHSMGGVVAYHVLAALTADPDFADRRPSHLVLSACAAPRDLPVAGLAGLTEEELLAHLRRFGAIPDEVANDRSLVELFLPAFRADYRVLEDAVAEPSDRLDVRATLVLGGRDQQTPPGTPAAWQEYLGRPLRTHVLAEEEHMFVLHAARPLDHILNGVAAAAA